MQIKILNITTQHEVCGIAKYQEQYMDALNDHDGIKSDLFPYSPNITKLMSQAQFSKVLAEFEQQLQGYDILHLQHEFAFYRGSQLGQYFDVAKKLGKKIVVTIHTSPEIVRPAAINPRGIRSSLLFLKNISAERRFNQSFTSPMHQADLIIVHNSRTQQVLLNLNLPADKVKLIELPVPNLAQGSPSARLHKALSVRSGDVLVGMVGFVAKVKGVDHAVRALSFLPANYKLAIIGGIHPESTDMEYLDYVCDMVVRHGLQDRVYITGFVPENDELNALIRECDVCVYPYEQHYYAGVSSAALADAFANHKPVIAYPTVAFQELNEHNEAMILCKSFNYYELARELKAIDIEAAQKASSLFTAGHSYPKVAPKLISAYQNLLTGARHQTDAEG